MPVPARVPVPVCLVLLALSLPTAAHGARWSAPVEGRVARPFALGADPYAAGWHRGIDLSAPSGAVVRAACSGRVTFAGGVGRTGLVVTVRCGRHLASHVGLGAVRVRRGTAVVAGTSVGVTGAGGSVHLGARLAATGAYVDPASLLGEGLRVPGGPVAVRPTGLGRAPSGPVPAPVRVPPWSPVLAPARGVARAGAPAPVPPAVWVGLALVLGAVPVGGLVSRRRRRAGVGVRRGSAPDAPR
jgi:murein DD-endopeptidase MepM/ murein hydrolase activator NlpD